MSRNNFPNQLLNLNSFSEDKNLQNAYLTRSSLFGVKRKSNIVLTTHTNTQLFLKKKN